MFVRLLITFTFMIVFVVSCTGDWLVWSLLLLKLA